ncbi:MAG: glycosyltransferase family 2 protein [Actinomycetota bacterium]|nr:glycosyltransferase family 2 protein [Actinomycetota bacterium]
MNLALIIVNYNTREDLRKCLLSLREKLDEPYTVVVDNGSSDGSREMVLEDFPWVRLVDNPGNPGYASACNRGLAETTQPYVLILNSDVEFEENGLREVLAYLEQNEDVGVLGPLVLNSDGSVQMSCRRFPSMRQNVVHGFLGDIWPDNRLTRSYQMKELERDRPCEVDWVSGAAIFLRRSAVREVGGFDEDYFMYVEDVDICWRLARAGFRTVFHPAFSLVHHIGRTSSQQSVRMLYQHHRSMYIFFRRRYEGWRGAAMAPVVMAGLAGRFLLSLLIQRLRARRERVGGS